MDAALAATPWAWVYYVSFVVLAVFVVVNLFIAIVINNLEAAKVEERAGHRGVPVDAAARIAAIREQLAEVEAALGAPKERWLGPTRPFPAG